MGISCFFGHKWNGCRCIRCDEQRDEGHDFQPEEGKCSEKCSTCGKTRPMEHQWHGCKCERCGKIQLIEGHDFQPEEGKCSERCSICGMTRRLQHQWHGCKCERCGEQTDTGHDFQREKGKCSEKCSICGKTRSLEHRWNGNACERCGADRKKVEIARVSALRESGLKAKGSSEIKKYTKELNKIAMEGGPASHRANLALRDIVLGNQNLGWDLPEIAGYITERSIAADPAIIAKIEKVKDYSIKFDRLMTAQDSGIGRSV